MEVELMVTKRDDNQPTTDRVNIEQSASGRLKGRVLQHEIKSFSKNMFSENTFLEIQRHKTKTQNTHVQG